MSFLVFRSTKVWMLRLLRKFYNFDSFLIALVPSLATRVTVNRVPAKTTSSVRTSISPSWNIKLVNRK